MLLLGIDLGSSSVKVSVLDGETGICLSAASYPSTEMKISAPGPGWAEQEPEMWWDNFRTALKACLKPLKDKRKSIGAIGVSYQMHGLVVTDKKMKVLRPAIIWCDSRAVEIGNRAFEKLGKDFCLHHLLNSPGNFTASKLAWIRENESAIFDRIHKIMLPGDFLAMKMTGEVRTTFSGLSEGIFWDFKRNSVSDEILDYFGFDNSLLAEALPSFSVQGLLLKPVAEELGLTPGIPVSYRAGDQPNNALSLNVLSPGEVAATAGTSGVMYGVTEEKKFDPLSRINTFLHVNNTPQHTRLGVLLCINGTGILNSWMKRIAGGGLDYPMMNDLAAGVKPGSDGLFILPFGNGAERVLKNRDINASLSGINFNCHGQSHLFRASQEGIAFTFRYGMEIMKETGIHPQVIRAGESNMFLSKVFRDVLSTVTGTVINLYNTDGSIGAARGAGIGCGYYTSTEEAFSGLRTVGQTEPDMSLTGTYENIYQEWKDLVEKE